MSTLDEALDQLREVEFEVRAVQPALWGALALAVVLVLGLLTSTAVLGIIGLFGGFLVGPFAVSKSSAALGTPAIIKYPLFLAALAPVLSLIPPVYGLMKSRSVLGDIEKDRTRLRVEDRKRKAVPAGTASAPAQAAPAASAAAPSSKGAPALQALPILRGVAPNTGVDGTPVKMQLAQGLPAEFADFEGPPMRATQGVFVVGYHLDTGASYTSVNASDLQDAGLTLDTLHQRSLGNLMRLAKGTGGQQAMRLVKNPPYYGLLLDGNHESCLVLLDGLWDHMLKDHTPNGAVVAIPTRDMLAFCDARSTEGIAALREMLQRFGPQPQAAVFNGLLLRRNGRWAVMP